MPTCEVITPPDYEPEHEWVEQDKKWADYMALIRKIKAKNGEHRNG